MNRDEIRPERCENCAALGDLRPSPRWRNLWVCSRCHNAIRRNLARMSDEALARADAVEAQIDAGTIRRGGVA